MPSAIKNGGLEATRVAAKQTALKDEVYYWLDNARFLVQGVLFRVPRLPFILGSRYFTEKHGLRHNGEDAEPIIHLQSVTAAHFRVFLKFLFPMPSNKPIESIFTKLEWITILHLCTVWHFPEFRKLAIQNLDGKLTEVELIHVGRALFVPVFVLEGYRAIVDRPKAEIITKEEAAAIGHESVNKLWVIRYQLHIAGLDTPDAGAVDRELRDSFSEELAELWRYEEDSPTAEEGEESAGVAQEESEKVLDVLGAADLPNARAEEKARDDDASPPSATVAVQGAGVPDPPEGPGQWRTNSEVPKTDPETASLAKALENLQEEERKIAKQLQEIKRRKLTLKAMDEIEAVSKMRDERLDRELRVIEEIRLDEGELVEALKEAVDDWFATSLSVQLENLRKRRAELEQQHDKNKGKETGQFTRWKKEGKRGKEKELAELSAKLLECQREQREVEERLRKVDQLGEDSTVDTNRRRVEGAAHVGGLGASAESRKGVDGRVGPHASHEVGAQNDDQRSERLRILEEEKRRVQQTKQTQLEREAKLKTQQTRSSRKLAMAERLLKQPGSSLPKTIQKAERKKVASTKKLQTIRTELEEVSQLLEMVRGEQERLENEKRLL